MGTRRLVALLVLGSTAVSASAPTVTGSSPAPGEARVARNALITLFFSEPMRVLETEGALRLQAGISPVTSCDDRWEWNAAHTSVSCQPRPALEAGARLRLTVGTAARSEPGEALAAERQVVFLVNGLTDPPSPSLLPQERTGRLPNSFGDPKDVVRRPAFLCAFGASGVGDPFTWITRNRVVRLTPSSQRIHTGLLSCGVITAGLAVASGFSFGEGIDVSQQLRRDTDPETVAHLRAREDGAMFRGWLFGGLALAAGTSTLLLWLLGLPSAASVTVFFGAP